MRKYGKAVVLNKHRPVAVAESLIADPDAATKVSTQVQFLYDKRLPSTLVVLDG